MVLRLIPPLIVSVDCGSGRDEEPSGEDVLRLIQDPFNVRRLYRNSAHLV
jgi:hypothetical protein